MNILGIETSCDETSISVVKDGKEILSLCTASQIDIHKTYGGVVPEVASRLHAETIEKLTAKALEESKKNLKDIDFIAVTNGPGLIGALLVGVCFANALAFSNKKKCIPVHHLEAHIYSAFMTNENIELPAIALLVSGGHTTLIYFEEIGKYKTIGKTLDDAAGEAFDKISQFLGLGYPGGPSIEKASKKGNPEKYNFPRAMLKHERKFDFSFSGLKTSVINQTKKIISQKNRLDEQDKYDIAASFQEAVIETLSIKTIKAAKEYKAKTIILAGGVAANKRLREYLTKLAEERGINLITPPLKLCGDNAAMVAGIAYHRIKFAQDYIKNTFPSISIEEYIS